jgi:glycosyltransferase involved in cell wall biosynthesis
MKPVSPNKRIQRQAIRLRRQNVMNRHSSGAVLDSVAICMIRNEQDIIEPFLRHTSPLVDLIVVLDNCSTDNSRSIVTETARELGNIVITDLPDRGYNQSETMTKALQHVQSVVFADFVFFLDADEFLSVDNRATLVKAVADIPPGSVGLMPWKTFVPDAAMSERKFIDPLERLKFRRKREKPQYYKAILRI